MDRDRLFIVRDMNYGPQMNVVVDTDSTAREVLKELNRKYPGNDFAVLLYCGKPQPQDEPVSEVNYKGYRRDEHYGVITAEDLAYGQ